MKLIKTALRQTIIDTIDTSQGRLTRPGLEKAVSRTCSVGRKQIRSAVRALVDDGTLAYTYEHGCSFIERSFQRPVRIGNRVVVTPPNMEIQATPGDVAVVIDPGDAFGTGRHPTTRLAVRAVETALDDLRGSDIRLRDHRMLDVGTGSGVLLIAALLMGVGKGVGIDREPCAVAEAKKNLGRNDLSARAVISDQDLYDMDDRFFLITANLRYPSLIRFAGRLCSMSAPSGLIVVSGVKTEEFAAVRDAYAEFGMTVSWQAAEKGWVGAVFYKHK